MLDRTKVARELLQVAKDLALHDVSHWNKTDRERYEHYVEMYGEDYPRMLQVLYDKIQPNYEGETKRHNEILAKLRKCLTDATDYCYKKAPGGHEYPGCIFQQSRKNLNKAFPRMFTDKQIQRALFSDRMKTIWNETEYLLELILRKEKRQKGRRRRGTHYTVRRDDSEIRLIICPACLEADIEKTDRKTKKGEGDGRNMQWTIYECNKCGAEFAFYPEDGVSEIEEELTGDEYVDLQDDGRDGHQHAPYIMLNRNTARKEMLKKAALVMLRKAKVLIASNPLIDMYGELPSNGNYGSAVYHEVGAARIAEAAHCILGSLSKIVNGGDRSIENGHIHEELGIIEKSMKESTHRDYVEQMNSGSSYAERAIENIRKVSPKLHALASSKQRALQSVKKDLAEDMFDVADACYEVVKLLAGVMQEMIDNMPVRDGKTSFDDLKLRAAVAKLSKAVKVMDFSYGRSARDISWTPKQAQEFLQSIAGALRKAKYKAEVVGSVGRGQTSQHDLDIKLKRTQQILKPSPSFVRGLPKGTDPMEVIAESLDYDPYTDVITNAHVLADALKGLPGVAQVGLDFEGSGVSEHNPLIAVNLKNGKVVDFFCDDELWE
jgi:hypothetical protein